MQCQTCNRNLNHDDHAATLALLPDEHSGTVQRFLCGDCPVDGPWEDCPA